MDLNRLMDDADATTVAEYIGMRIQRKGNRNYILCPGHRNRLGKEDRSIGNCVLTAHGYRCFACGETVGIVQMVMEYTGCTKGEAFSQIADAMGGRELYADSGTEAKPTYGPKEKLTQEELALLGINCSYNSGIITDNGMVPDGLNTLYFEDKAKYTEILLGRAKKTLASYEELLHDYGSPQSEKSHRIYELMGENYDTSVYSVLKAETNRRMDILKGAIAKLSQQAVV